MRSHGGLTMLAGAGVAVVLAAPAGAWLRTITGSRSSFDTMTAAAATPDGGVVVFGCPQGLVRLDGESGRPRWQRGGLPSPENCPWYHVDAGLVVARDGTIALAVAGSVERIDGDSGVERWHHEVDGSNDDDPARLVTVAVDPAGDVLAAGSLDQGGDEDTFDQNFLVEKIAGTDGRVLWRRLLDGSPRSLPDDCGGGCDSPGYPDDHANAVAVRDDGTVVAAGAIERGDVPHFAVIAFDSATGEETWRWESDVRGEAFAIVTDAGGAVVAAGHVDGAPVVRAFGADGTVRWERALVGDDQRDGWRTLSIGAAHDVVVGGRIGGRATVVAYASDGTLRWRANEPDRGEGVALAWTASGAVVALLGLDGTSAIDLGRWRVRALDPTTGASRWLVDPTDGAPLALAGGAGRGLIVAGTSQTPGTFFDATAIALDPDTGRERWRRDLDTPAASAGRAEAVAVSPGGDVVAAGYVANSVTGFDFTVTALAPHAGREHWRRELPDVSYDVAHAVRTDARGDVVAGGRIRNLFGVTKLDGATGTDRWLSIPDADWEYGAATVLAIDGRGSVVAGGQVSDIFTVRKLDGETGALVWDRRIPADDFPFFDSFVLDLATLPDGVLAAGVVPDARRTAIATVVRLADSTGEVTWRRALGPGSATSLVTRDGAVMVGGQIAMDGLRSGFVAALDQATGEERWREIVRAGASTWQTVRAVAIDARGDVVACAEVSGALALLVRKLEATSGATLWERRLRADDSGFAPPVHCALDPDGGVVVAFPGRDATGADVVGVVALDGATGASRWERSVAAAIDVTVGGIASDPAGNVFVAAGQFGPNGFFVVGLGSRSGSPRPPRPHRFAR